MTVYELLDKIQAELVEEDDFYNRQLNFRRIGKKIIREYGTVEEWQKWEQWHTQQEVIK